MAYRESQEVKAYPSLGKAYDAENHTLHNDNVHVEEGEGKGLKRELQARHLAMISLGGTIGTGLFVASGGAIQSAGPVGALLAYAFMGLTVFCAMTALGEMATLIPVSGSFNHYAARFVDPALGFALSWNYWLSWAITIGAELSAAGIIISFWPASTVVPVWAWALMLLAIILAFNMFGGKGYGEAEYWLSLIKIITVLVFILVGILVAAGALGGTTHGFKHWKDPGAFNPAAPWHNGFANFASTMLVVGFSYMGTEMVGIAAGESANPTKAVPKAIKSVFWRILLFFLCSIFLIGLIIPYNDPDLGAGGEDNIGKAPFTLVFSRAKVQGIDHIMNAVLLTVILSASNSALYCGSRTIMSMALEGKAPKIFAKINRRGVPVPALIATSFFGVVVAAAQVFAGESVFAWVLGMSAVTGFVSWAGIGFTHLRFRKAYIAQGRDLSRLPYKAIAFPASSLLCAIVCTLVTLTSGYDAFVAQDMVGEGDAATSVGVKFQFSGLIFVQRYVNLVFFLALWIGYKLVKKTKMVPLLDADFDTGVRWYEHDNKESKAYVHRTVPQKIVHGLKAIPKSIFG
ncbi:amino acid permease/ SLC12A domain-containing protein [Phlyctochytrium arcticum]|nr:amino acid permease/ SLC12A domain-containing protein [Phlyctochytrium arcticum]